MALATKLSGDEVGNARRDAAQLRMAEGILQSRRRKEFPVRSLYPLRYGDDALVVTRQSLLDLGQEAFLVECHLRQQQDMRRIALTFSGKRGGGCRPARVPPHQFHREHLG